MSNCMFNHPLNRSAQISNHLEKAKDILFYFFNKIWISLKSLRSVREIKQPFRIASRFILTNKNSK